METERFSVAKLMSFQFEVKQNAALQHNETRPPIAGARPNRRRPAGIALTAEMAFLAGLRRA